MSLSYWYRFILVYVCHAHFRGGPCLAQALAVLKEQPRPSLVGTLSMSGFGGEIEADKNLI